MSKIPIMDSLRSAGLDLPAIMGKVSDDDYLVDGITEELELMFSNHGKVFPLGKFSDHSDATEDKYETYTEQEISLDPESREHGITSMTYSVIPAADVKTLTAAVYGIFADEPEMEKFNAEYDRQVTEDAFIAYGGHWGYFANGWPMAVQSTSVFKLMDRQKLKQESISWDNYSFRNH